MLWRVPAAPLPEHLEVFLGGPRPCVLATVRADGSPVTVCCWYEYDSGRIKLSMEANARRVEHIRANPNVALTVLADDWYNHVSLLGKVVDLRDDPELADPDRLSMRYLGTPWTEQVPSVTAIVEVTRWHTFGSPGVPNQSRDSD
jgi:PPOX class probable F420-dependent enzyme